MSTTATLAWRNLWRHGRRTWLTVAAMIFCNALLVFLISFQLGSYSMMIDGNLGVLTGHLQVQHKDYNEEPKMRLSVPHGAELAQALRDKTGLESIAARDLTFALASSEERSFGIQIMGVDPSGEIALGFKTEDIVEGRFLESPEDKGIVIGRKLADRLETGLGKRVVIMSQSPDNEVADKGMRIVGIYKARLQATEEFFVYTGRGNLQKMLQAQNSVSEIAMTADNYLEVDKWWPAVAEVAGPEVSTEPWTKLDGYLNSVLEVQGNMNIVIMIVIFLAPGLAQIVGQYDVEQNVQLLMALNLPFGSDGTEFGGLDAATLGVPFQGKQFSTGPGVFLQLAYYF